MTLGSGFLILGMRSDVRNGSMGKSGLTLRASDLTFVHDAKRKASRARSLILSISPSNDVRRHSQGFAPLDGRTEAPDISNPGL